MSERENQHPLLCCFTVSDYQLVKTWILAQKGWKPEWKVEVDTQSLLLARAVWALPRSAFAAAAQTYMRSFSHCVSKSDVSVPG